MKNYTYPVIIRPCMDVAIPDFGPCALTCADSMKNAVVAAREVLQLYILDYLESGKELPEPSFPEVNEGETLIFIDVMVNFTPDEVYVKKTLTLPKYLDDVGKERGINFSKTLADAIRLQTGVI